MADARARSRTAGGGRREQDRASLAAAQARTGAGADLHRISRHGPLACQHARTAGARRPPSRRIVASRALGCRTGIQVGRRRRAGCDRRRRGGVEPAAPLPAGRQPGAAVEPDAARATHRPRGSPRPAPPSPRHPPGRRRDGRGTHRAPPPVPAGTGAARGRLRQRRRRRDQRGKRRASRDVGRDRGMPDVACRRRRHDPSLFDARFARCRHRRGEAAGGHPGARR